MGCFNRTGFLSHLPIGYEDEIVVFLLADNTKVEYQTSIPCYPNSGGYTPLCLPFFGTYDDYGGIENVVDDFNSRYLKKKVGMSVEEVCNLLQSRNSVGLTYRNILTDLEKLNDPSYDEYGKDRDIKEYEKLKVIYEKILGIDEDYEKKVDKGSGKYRWEIDMMADSTIIFTMELKSVYEKMGEVAVRDFEGDVDYGFCRPDDHHYTLEEKFDITNKCVQLFANTRKSVNPITFGLTELYSLMDEDVLELVEEGQLDAIKDLMDKQRQLHKYSHYDFIGIHTRLSGSTPMPLDYRLYEGCFEDISEMKEDVIKYVRFLDMMHIQGVIFTQSPYHNQCIDYDRVVAYSEEILNIIKAKKAAYEKEVAECDIDEEDEEK